MKSVQFCLSHDRLPRLWVSVAFGHYFPPHTFYSVVALGFCGKLASDVLGAEYRFQIHPRPLTLYPRVQNILKPMAITSHLLVVYVKAFGM